MHDMDLAWEVARDLALRLKGPYLVSDWTRDNANMFRALKLEKTMMAILLSLIIAMGAFNLVSSQVMLVTDKQADIAILRQSEARRVGKECVSKGRYRWSPTH